MLIGKSAHTAIVFSMALLALAGGEVAHGEQQGTEKLSSIVTRMEEAQQRNRDNYRAYTLTREYKLFGAQEDKPKSEVLAEVTFVPPDQKDYTIERSAGNDRGLNVVKRILDNEKKAAASPDVPGAINSTNYDFAFAGEGTSDGQQCWILQLQPKRDDKMLIRGKAFVDKESYLIHQIEGELSKSPSWWIKNVYTTIQFGNAGGMWMQTNTRAVADVRIAGKHVFTARAVKLQTGNQVATKFSALPPPFAMAWTTSRVGGARVTARVAKHRPIPPVPAIMGAGIFVRR